MSAPSVRRRLCAGIAVCAIVALAAACGGSADPASSAADVKKNVKLVDATPAATGQLDRATWLLPKEPTSLDLSNDGNVGLIQERKVVEAQGKDFGIPAGPPGKESVRDH